MPIVTPTCAVVPPHPGTICITLPGGAQLCSSTPAATPPDPFDVVMSLMGQLNTALGPLAPIFTILDTVVALIDTVKATPKIVIAPDEFAEALKKLAEATAQLLRLIPQLSIPIMLVDILKAMALTMAELANWVVLLVEAFESIALSEQAAAQYDLSGLAEVALCGRAQLEASIAAQSEALAPLNTIINTVNALMEVIGLGAFALPTLGDIDTENLDVVKETFEAIAEVMLTIVEVIPL